MDLPSHHRGLGATLADDNIPLHYGDPATEYRAAVEAAVLLDRSHEGRVLLTGESRQDLVNRMSTNDVMSMSMYDCRPTVFTKANARILFRVTCLHLPQGLLLIGEPGQGPALLNMLRRNIFYGDNVSAGNLGSETAQFALYGNGAEQVMEKVNADLPNLRPMCCAIVEMDGIAITVVRHKPIISAHWTLICSASHASHVHQSLLRLGVPAGLAPAGSLTYNILRIRSGRPAGLELSADYLPLELGLWDEISFEKGCYTGQEIIARMESRQRLAKTLVKLNLTRFVAAPNPVYYDGKVAGRLTSSVQSPDGNIYALAVLGARSAGKGTQVQVGEDRVAAEVTGYAGVQAAFVTGTAEKTG